MTSTVDVACKWCASTFTARVADRKRGWARFCSKPCKASHQQFGGNKAFWEAANPNNKRSNIGKYTDRLLGLDREYDDDGSDEILDGLSDMDYGASDGGGYESIR
jgi:hypothetical protein